MCQPIMGSAVGKQSVEITRHLPARLESGSDETPRVFAEADRTLDSPDPLERLRLVRETFTGLTGPRFLIRHVSEFLTF